MAYHFIAIASDYAGGRRIGWHYASNTILEKEVIKTFLDRSKDCLGSIEFGIHKLSTTSTTWDSVVDKDSFFEDVYVIEDIDTFLDILSCDMEVEVFDIAKFFLSIAPMTHLKLQKLLYFAYATYLVDFKKSLFPQKIVAFKYGPVIEDVYHEYKCFGKEEIEENKEESFQLVDVSLPTIVLKILLSSDGDNILNSLTKTLVVYGNLTAAELVDVSHVEGGPWDTLYQENKNVVINDPVIEEAHEIEVTYARKFK